MDAQAEAAPRRGRRKSLLTALTIGVCAAGAGVAAAASTDFTELTPSSPRPVAPSGAPKDVAAADFDGDLDVDLAVANFDADAVTIHKNNGSGAFHITATELVGNGPNSVFAADLDGDTDIDLAVANQDTASVTLLRNRNLNSGKFVEPPSSPEVIGGSAGWAVTGGDFDGDSDVDLAVSEGTFSSTRGVTILRHSNHGMSYKVTDASPLLTGFEPLFIVSADFNGDGDPDLATADHSSAQVTILRGRSGAKFREAGTSPVSTTFSPNELVAANLNSDTDPDLAVVAGQLAILRGKAHASFREAGTSPETVGSNAFGVTAADFDGDTENDLAVSHNSSSSLPDDVTILEHQGTALNFVEPATSPESAGEGGRGITAADVDGDLDPDLVVANFFGHTLTLLGNN